MATPNTKFGINKETWGNNIMTSTTVRIATKKGREAFAVSSGEHSIMEEVVYKAIPTGGVMIPIVVTVIMTMPKCTGSIPNEVTTGSNIGVRRSATTVVSTNIPAIVSNATIRKSITVGLLVIPINAVAIT
jgi:hypothetical protein